MENDNGMLNVTIGDWSNPAAVDAYLDFHRSLVATEVVDGHFADKPNVFPIRNASLSTGWEICETASGPGKHTWSDACAEITESQANGYTAGRERLMSSLLPIYTQGGASQGGVVFDATNATNGNTATFYYKPFKADAIHERVLAYLQSGYRYVYFMADQQTDSDPSDLQPSCSEDHIGLFLLGVEEGCILGCNGWSEDFERPLGAPLGNATRSGDIMTRKFASGTYVEYDVAKRTAKVHWAV